MLRILAFALIWTLSRQNVDCGDAKCTVIPCLPPVPGKTICATNSTNYLLFDGPCFLHNYNCQNQNKNQRPYVEYNCSRPCPDEDCCRIAYLVDPTYCGFNGTHYRNFYGGCFMQLWNCKFTNQCPYERASNKPCCDTKSKKFDNSSDRALFCDSGSTKTKIQ